MTSWLNMFAGIWPANPPGTSGSSSTEIALLIPLNLVISSSACAPFSVKAKPQNAAPTAYTTNGEQPSACGKGMQAHANDQENADNCWNKPMLAGLPFQSQYAHVFMIPCTVPTGSGPDDLCIRWASTQVCASHGDVLHFGNLYMQALPSFAADPTKNRETPNSDPYIQDLLRKTEEKREERYQARLNDYYRRNFKEYFQVHPH